MKIKVLYFLAVLFCTTTSYTQTEKFLKVEAALSNPKANTNLVMAHRADWRNHPENSIPAIKSCIDMGVDIIEIDVRITKDKQIVVIHDKTLDRVSTGLGKVSHSSLFEIKQLFLKNGYGVATHNKIPTLEEVLTLTKNKVHVMIDKAYYILPEVWKVVKKIGVENQVFFEGKVPLDEFIKTYPSLIKTIRYMPRISPETKDLDNYITSYKSYANVPIFITSFTKEDKYFLKKIQELREQNINVMGTTLSDSSCAKHTDDVSVENPKNGWGWMIDKGFNVLCTDRPQQLITYLKNRNNETN